MRSWLVRRIRGINAPAAYNAGKIAAFGARVHNIVHIFTPMRTTSRRFCSLNAKSPWNRRICARKCMQNGGV
eukprot:3185624-Lingulodinium_polyedra.AAC.1